MRGGNQGGNMRVTLMVENTNFIVENDKLQFRRRSERELSQSKHCSRVVDMRVVL